LTIPADYGPQIANYKNLGEGDYVPHRPKTGLSNAPYRIQTGILK
jgi:hypothetical protein